MRMRVRVLRTPNNTYGPLGAQAHHTHNPRKTRVQLIVQLVQLMRARACATLASPIAEMYNYAYSICTLHIQTNETKRVYKFAHMKRNKLMRAHFAPFGRKSVVCVCLCRTLWDANAHVCNRSARIQRYMLACCREQRNCVCVCVSGSLWDAPCATLRFILVYA